MSKNSVLSNLHFSGLDTWKPKAGAIPGVVGGDHMLLIAQAIEYLYDNSLTARETLEHLANQGPIRFGTLLGEDGFAKPEEQADGVMSDPYVVLSPDTNFKGINAFGEIFDIPFAVVIAHELGHWRFGYHDSLGKTNLEYNTANYDYVGQNIRDVEWTVSAELGLNVRASDLAALSDSDPRFSYLDQTVDYNGDSYSEIVRLGDIEENSDKTLNPHDLMDFRARTDGKSVLAFGFTGRDSMYGGSGENWLYGGTGIDDLQGGNLSDHLFGEDDADEINGKAGNDVLVGGGGSDIIVGGAGNDEFWGDDEGDVSQTNNNLDVADYSDSAASISLIVNATSGLSLVTVKDGLGGLDTLNSIELVKGTVKQDILQIFGSIMSNIKLTFDANGGQSGGADILHGSSLAGNYGFTVDIDESGFGSVTDNSTSGVITLKGFHTDIIGTEGDDVITDASIGEKLIDAGAGNDTVTVGATSQIWGGSGNDVITGSSQNDTIYGGSGANTLNGGAGSDRIVVTGDIYNRFSGIDSNLVSGGAGNDWVEVRGFISQLDGGAGNDVFEFLPGRSSGSPSASVVDSIVFGVGSGHDIVLDHIDTPGFSAVVNLDLSSLSRSDVSFIWERSTPVFNDSESDNSPYLRAYGNLAIVINYTGDSIVIPNVSGVLHEWDDDQLWYLEIDPLFSDGYMSDYTFYWDGAPLGYNGQLSFGSVASYSTAPQDYLLDTAGDGTGAPSSDDDLISGGGGNDAVDGGTGDDTFRESAGADAFDGGDGLDTVALRGSAADYRFERDADGAVRIRSASGEGADLITSSVERVSFMADLTNFSMGALAGTMGTTGNDLISSAAPNVRLYGLAGDDTFNVVDGSAVVDGGEGEDVVILRGNPASYGMSLDQNGNVSAINPLGGAALLFQRANDGSVRIQDNLDPSFSVVIKNVEAVSFSGLSTEFALNSLAGDYGTSDADLIEGTAWSNRLFGLGGSDTISWSYGIDYIDGGDGVDTFVSAGSSSDYQIFKDQSGDVVIIANGGSDVSTVRNVEWLHFDGGATIIDATQVAFLPILGSDDDDFILGTEEGDRIYGNHGDDSIDGLGGGDEYYWQLGDGFDYISDWSENQADTDRLILVDVDSSNVIMSNSYDDLLIEVVSTGEQITIAGQFYADRIGVEAIQFANGLEIARSEIEILANQLSFTRASLIDNERAFQSSELETLTGYVGTRSDISFDASLTCLLI